MPLTCPKLYVVLSKWDKRSTSSCLKVSMSLSVHQACTFAFQRASKDCYNRSSCVHLTYTDPVNFPCTPRARRSIRQCVSLTPAGVKQRHCITIATRVQSIIS